MKEETTELDALTGATLSSKGMKKAVDTALNAYKEYTNETSKGGEAGE